jgi:uncharacterized protein
LRGKSISTPIYPLTFREFLNFKSLSNIKYSTKGIADILRFFDEYMRYGSFPAIPTTEITTKEYLLREYFNTMILKDIIQRHNVSTPNQCITLYKYLISYMSKPFTFDSCYKYIKQTGLTTNKDAIRDFVKYAADAWFLFNIQIFSSSTKQQELNYKKSYAIDWALANFNSPVWDGYYSRAFENIIYVHLKQFYSSINYYLTKSGREEVDFVVSNKEKSPEMLIQVSLDISNIDTLNREVKALAKTAEYFKCKNNFIITYNSQKTINIGNVKISVLPVYEFLLDILPS